jgi:hypothetical protein
LEEFMSEYVITCILGMAESEERKVFPWQQWQHCVPLVDDVLGSLAKGTVIRCSMAYEIPKKPFKSDPPGTRRVTYKSLTMGRLKWNLDNNRKWSERPLSADEYPIRHIETMIVSACIDGQPPDVFINVINRDTSPGSVYNQIIVMSISESRWSELSTAEWDSIVDGLGAVAGAVRIGRTQRPWVMERPRGAYTEMSVIADHSFDTRYDSLELDDRWQTWSYLR